MFLRILSYIFYKLIQIYELDNFLICTFVLICIICRMNLYLKLKKPESQRVYRKIGPQAFRPSPTLRRSGSSRDYLFMAKLQLIPHLKIKERWFQLLIHPPTQD